MNVVGQEGVKPLVKPFMRTQSVRGLATAAVLVCVLALAATAGRAALPTFWHVSTQAEFLRGEVEELSIDEDGRLVLGPRTELIHETTGPFVWTVIAAPGGGLWAGSGNDGKVISVAEDGTSSTFFDADELEVHALAATPDGGLYVGTAPDGQIYKVEADGSATTFFNPEEKYIWTLAVDAAGDVFAGTGDKGIIYRISPDGEGEPFYRTNAGHVLSLTFDAQGNLLAGTEAPGQVFRIDRDGEAFVLLDSSYREIRALRVDGDGVIYAAAVSGRPAETDRPPSEPTSAAPVPSVSISTEITAIGIAVSPSAGGQAPQTAAPRRGTPRGAVYRIAPDGVWDIAWSSSEDSPYDVTFGVDGALVIGTGSKGKIYRVAGEPSRTVLLARAPAQQVTMFLRDDEGQNYYATANPGKLFKLSSERVEEGNYESEVLDAKTVAAWGTIRWRGSTPDGTRIQLFTRSGNTSTPNEIWSPWSAAYTDPNGEQIASPKARYLQWKAVLSGSAATPMLTSVDVAYLPRNLRPQVTSITVHPPGRVFQRPFSSGEPRIAGLDETATNGLVGTGSAQAAASSVPQVSPLGRQIYRKGLQTFVWNAEDPNEDQLQFDVLYRREDETRWRTLKRDLRDSIYAWDTTSVPDGTYLIKIAASDAATNSPGDALVGELESTAFDIDNSPPRIEMGLLRQDGERRVLPFTVTDAHSPVQHVEYSLDANKWHAIYPMDGIPDSRTEQFEIVFEGDVAAEHIIIRASDAMSNLTTAMGGD